MHNEREYNVHGALRWISRSYAIETGSFEVSLPKQQNNKEERLMRRIKKRANHVRLTIEQREMLLQA